MSKGSLAIASTVCDEFSSVRDKDEAETAITTARIKKDGFELPPAYVFLNEQ